MEGPEAGGHLAFKHDDLINNTSPKLEELAKDLISFANDPNNFENPVPVILAGGIYTGQDIAYYHKLFDPYLVRPELLGFQMATRFVTTHECDADDRFKREYLNATKDDLVIIKSPVGMPGRAIKNKFLEDVMNGNQKKFTCVFNCLKTCKPKDSLYCIADALIEAQKGNLEKGFAFAGSNAYKATPESCLDKDGKFIAVKTLMQRISNEYNSS